MNKEDKRLIRQFYQGLATPKERDLFYEVLRMPQKDKVRYLASSALNKYGINAETHRAILYASTMTKADLMAIIAQEVRGKYLSRFFNWIGGLFS